MSGLLVACLIVGSASAGGVPSSNSSSRGRGSSSNSSNRVFCDGITKAGLRSPGLPAAKDKASGKVIWFYDPSPDVVLRFGVGQQTYMCVYDFVNLIFHSSCGVENSGKAGSSEERRTSIGDHATSSICDCTQYSSVPFAVALLGLREAGLIYVDGLLHVQTNCHAAAAAASIREHYFSSEGY